MGEWGCDLHNGHLEAVLMKTLNRNSGFVTNILSKDLNI